MKYQKLDKGSSYPFPDHNIDPREKDAKFCCDYAKAMFYDWSYGGPKSVFAANNGEYEKFRMYALGKQPTDQYKKMLGVDAETNTTWLEVDWTVRPIISTYRDKALARLAEQKSNIVATPIDMLAKAELDQYYNEIKAKIAVRKLMERTNPELAQHPLISLSAGEPMDVEELEMRIELGEQFNRSKDAELAVQLGFYENNIEMFEKETNQNSFDLGVSGYKEWLGDDNKGKFRSVNPDNVITSFCRKSDFSDMVHAGELIDVSLVDLAVLKNAEGNSLFTEQQLIEFAESITNQSGNQNRKSSNAALGGYDKFKCQVLDMEFYSYNDMVYRNAPDENGNEDFRKADYNRGKKSEKYIRKCIKVVYKCKWIVGTEYCYDWGLATDMKRAVDPKKLAETSLSFKFCASNFHEMKAQGMMERLIPYLDDYQLTIYKIQNFKNRAVPSGWWIDYDALKSVAMNKGGKNMEPRDLLQMFFETGVLIGSSLEADGSPKGTNWKPVIPIENTAASELAMFYQDLLMTIQAIERMTGFNDVTSGNPNPKTLVPGYEISEASTNHALYPMKFVQKYLTKKLAEDMLIRMKQGIRKGGVSGYAPALNSNLLQFVKLESDLSLRDHGIMLEDKTTQEEKQWLYQMMQGDIANGFLDVSDAVLLVSTHNAKQAMSIWSYRVKKSKERLQQQKMAEIQATNEGNLQAAQVAGQQTMQMKMMEYQASLKEKEMTVQGELAKEQMRIEAETAIKMKELEYKFAMNQNDNLTKLQVSQDQVESKVVATDLAGEHAQEKQRIANQKPVSSPSKK